VQPDYLTPAEVAARLNVAAVTVRTWIAKGSLPAFRVGGRWRVLRKDLPDVKP